ncbi:TRAP C4-dicarboxylate transport system permease DctM subunit [Anaeromyxobacter sp. K]|uniref:TRAP transporter large permease n=1 Tax=Anaeromyxobacter sp. (strain K) TaxID=447217 RepID=UPI00015F8A76|nr:TRAP transporter large permease subunit [Anaeromyxobacter sp. K]ACG74200.1 TRAP C4-dicarboxylate transport system permease DctM subunit [Anaeromyxobacter sp. K]
MRKELWFGLGMMAVIVAITAWIMPAPAQMTGGHLGLLMLSLVVVAIMLGFPTAFTLMGMGVLFAWLAYRFDNPAIATQQTLDLMVQRTYAVMTNDVLISIPLFVFMGYLVERANLIERLFKSLHLAMAFVPGSLAVATLATCALFATATGIVGAVVTLMGLLAFPAMLRSGYDIKLSAGAITAGGCLGILIPPSVMLILYGATAGVSVVQLYAGAFFPGLLLAGLYIAYVVLIARLRPSLAPPATLAERTVTLPEPSRILAGGRRRLAVPALLGALARPRPGVGRRWAGRQLAAALLPAAALAAGIAVVHGVVTAERVVDTGGLVEVGDGDAAAEEAYQGAELAPLEDDGAPAEAGAEPVPTAGGGAEVEEVREAGAEAPVPAAPADRKPAPAAFWIAVAAALAALAVHYGIFTLERLEILKMLLTSFFPLTTLILAVLGSIVFGWATPTEAAALGAAGAMVLTGAYRQFRWSVLKESVFLTAKTTAMVCWLFVGSSIFSAAFALLGGQGLIERWVLGLDLTPIQFMVLAQAIIFLLGWPLEWTEIIVIFMPIFIPLLGHFQIDPLFFGLLVALNLQTAFLSPPVAMAAFYLKGVAPRHVTLNQIFAGMMPFMAIQLLALVLLYVFPQIGLWLPRVLYR